MRGRRNDGRRMQDVRRGGNDVMGIGMTTRGCGNDVRRGRRGGSDEDGDVRSGGIQPSN